MASASSPTVPLHGLCGYAPGGIPAYSNGNDETFTAKGNYDGHFFTGYQWQCVEFARRWLLERKGLVLPEYYIAAHIIYGTHVYDLNGHRAPCTVVKNGSLHPPCADSLIIYPSRKQNVVGHIGVIVEASESFVRVADQNRFFHDWKGKGYSAEFPVEKRADGRFYIHDPEAQPVGWVCFCNYPNRPEGLKLAIPSTMKAPPKAWIFRHLSFVMDQVRDHYLGSSRTSASQCSVRVCTMDASGEEEVPVATSSSCCCGNATRVNRGDSGKRVAVSTEV